MNNNINKSNTDNIILLCACKKYTKEQKNGILLVKLKINNSDIWDKSHKFFDTGKFEVYCFCPISSTNEIINKNKKYTKYFLVGGFDTLRKKGLIKLYKIKKNKNNKNITIEFIQNIETKLDNKDKGTKDFNGFRGPISCITQSLSTGNILITCFDGNVYLFANPNLDILKREKIIIN